MINLTLPRKDVRLILDILDEFDNREYINNLIELIEDQLDLNER